MRGILVLVSVVSALPRGVAPSDADKYQPDSEGNWACTGDPSIVIPWEQVNDDYCDCPDGSDEPGTSACSNGRFWCMNVGHIGQFAPSRIIDDGVCDYSVCCDGSDEAPGLCQNKCSEVHAAYLEELERNMNRRKEGWELRKTLVAEAESRRLQLEQTVNSIDTNQLQAQVRSLEEDLERIQKEDADFGKGVDVTSLKQLDQAKQAVKQFDETEKVLIDLVQSWKSAYGELESALSKMATDYNPNFNDPAVKEALKVWRERETPSEHLIQRLDAEGLINSLDSVKVASSSEGQNSVPLIYRFANKLGLSTVLEPLLELLNDYGIDLIPKYDHNGNEKFESPRVQAARVSLENGKKELGDRENELRQAQNKLKQEWGPDEIGRSLEGQCVSNNIGEYNWQICFYGDAVQKGNGQNQKIGSQSSLLVEDDHLVAEFTGGSHCWNGPNRSGRANIVCGLESRLLSVEEPEKCRYKFEISSPAACAEVLDDIIHDEL